MKIRIIVSSNDNGSKECVIFTEDFDSEAEDFVPFGLGLSSDTITEITLPTAFPLEYELWRQ